MPVFQDDITVAFCVVMAAFCVAMVANATALIRHWRLMRALEIILTHLTDTQDEFNRIMEHERQIRAKPDDRR